MQKAFSMLAVSLLGTACTTAYVTPNRSDLATLTVMNKSDIDLLTVGFKNHADCSGGKLEFSSRVTPKRGELKIKLAPDEPFSYLISYQNVSVLQIKYVNLPLTFTPQPGKEYQMIFEDFGSGYDVNMRVRSGADWIKDTSFKIRQWRRPFSEDGSFCEPEQH